ncbi:putative Phytocyanin domain, cupredoxin [Helianthus annuus]|nr:putative Phytocyanin domain, cupredoxin [Helianthus annuus]
MPYLKLNLVAVTIIVMAYMHVSTMVRPSLHFVGGIEGWVAPPEPNYYEKWVKEEKFLKYDTALFIFDTGSHTLAEVTKEAYDTCNTTNPIYIDTWGPAAVELDTVGVHFYICTMHCKSGQKITVDVKPRNDTF